MQATETFFEQVESVILTPLEQSLIGAKIVSHRHVGQKKTGDEYRLFAIVTFRTKDGDIPVEAFTRLGEYPRERSRVWEDTLTAIMKKHVASVSPQIYRPINGDPELTAIIYFEELYGCIHLRLASREDPFRLSAPLIGEHFAEILRTEYGSTS